jgi:hypothetical protein
MKKSVKNRTNFVDALKTQHKYAVVTKSRRIQVLIQPTVKQLRRRGKRGWQLYGTVASNPDAGRTLLDTIQRAVLEMESTGEAAGNDGREVKPSKTTSK